MQKDVKNTDGGNKMLLEKLQQILVMPELAPCLQEGTLDSRLQKGQRTGCLLSDEWLTWQNIVHVLPLVGHSNGQYQATRVCRVGCG